MSEAEGGAPVRGGGGAEAEGGRDRPAGETPVFVARRPEERAGSRRWPTIAAALGALSLTVALLGPRLVGGSVTGGPSATDPPPPADTTDATSPRPEPAPAGSSAKDARSRFGRLADSVRTSAEAYTERKRLHADGRLGCSALRDAYRRLDRHFIDLAVAVRRRGAGLDPALRARFRELAGRTEEASRHFDASRCAGP